MASFAHYSAKQLAAARNLPARLQRRSHRRRRHFYLVVVGAARGQLLQQQVGALMIFTSGLSSQRPLNRINS